MKTLGTYKNIFIAGFGKEGQSTYKFLKRLNKNLNITIADKKPKLYGFEDIVNDTNTHLKLGEDYLSDLGEYDLIIRSPGIHTNAFGKHNAILSSQTELFINEYCNQIVGITGTKGKSTSVSLLYNILKENGNDVILAGNIGIPVFDIIDLITPETIIVLELSCHQLHHIKISPKYAILINLFPEHLDYYENTAAYYSSKLNIISHQKQGDIAIINNGNKAIKELTEPLNHKGKLIKCSSYFNDESNQIIYYQDGKFLSKNDPSFIVDITNIEYLNTKHLTENLTLILNMAHALLVPSNKIQQGLNSFQPLEHRAEVFGEFEGIKFVNDSISTIPESTIASINSIPNISTIILGGKNRGVNYQELITIINNSSINNIICMEETGKLVYNQLKNIDSKKALYFLEELTEVVDFAYKVTNKNAYCLFSPAASSYNKYKNFEERGSLFKLLVKQYVDKKQS